MSKPKILTMFDETAEGSIYSKLNNPVTTTVIDRSLIVSDITDAHDNSIVTFKPGCDSSDVDSITINGEVYTIKDSLGNVVTGNTGMWVNGAVISVALDTTNKAAYILNNNYSTGAESEVFMATYGTTTYAEIKAAYDAGKVCLCKKENEIKQLIKISNSFALFSSVMNTLKLTLWKIGYNDAWSENVKEGYTPNSHASTHASGGADPITPASIGASAISNVVNVTLSASSWTGDSAPYTYTLAVTGVTTSSNQELLPAVNITAEKLTALQAANIQDGGQSADTIVLKAFGDKPTIDIPIRVILRGDS